MEQKISFKEEARQKLLNGVDKLADVVSSTLGPSGHSVILNLNSIPVSTKDGVTIAKAITLSDLEENTGVQMLKQASIKTGEEAGDGTTTATVLAREMYKAGINHETENYNSVEYRKGMDDAAEAVIAYIKKEISKPVTGVEQLKQVATISANGDEQIGKLVSTALDKVGQEGAVTVEESKTGESYLDIVEGIQFDRGYKSPYFVTDNGSMQAILDHPMILLVDKKLGNIKELLPALEYAANVPDSSLLIIAEDIDGEVLSTLVLNKVRAGFKVCAVKAPEFGDRRKEVLEDIAILTGGTVISPDKGMKLENFKPEFLGHAKKVTVTKDKTTIIEAKGTQESIDKRIADIQTLIENAKSIYDKEQYQLRLARLIGGIAVIYVGGHTELEMKERKDRVDDALHATKAALEEGLCPGGGKALLDAAYHILNAPKKEKETVSESYAEGFCNILSACAAPFYTILKNAGIDKDSVLFDPVILPHWESYNPATKSWVDMYEEGIIDPTKVIRTALKNAVSVSGTMLTSEALVVNCPDPKEQEANDNPMQMF